MSDYTPTVEWLKAQIRNEQYQLNVQRAKNEKLQEITKSSEKCTQMMAKLISKAKLHAAYNLIIDMNEFLVDECDAITNALYDTLFNPMQELTITKNT